MIRWLRSLFAWRTVIDTGVWRYEQNDVTLDRRAFKARSGHQPLDIEWLTAGKRIFVSVQDGFVLTGQRVTPPLRKNS